MALSGLSDESLLVCLFPACFNFPLFVVPSLSLSQPARNAHTSCRGLRRPIRTNNAPVENHLPIKNEVRW